MTALLAARVVKACIDTSVTLATAESLTAGLVAARIAEVPGCSAMLRGGVIAYATDVKAQVLGLDQVSLEQVVSESVASQLAQAATRVLGSDIGVGTTGVAGPDWLAGEPPGIVWIAVFDARSDVTLTRRLELKGDRAAIREGTVFASLELVLSLLAEAGE
jgi:nicotinamide-nucleotide amidase